MGLVADKPKPPLKVLSCIAELKASTPSDSLLSLLFETLFTLFENIDPADISKVKAQRPGSLSFNSLSISCNVSKSSGERSLLNFISAIIVFAFSGEST